VRYRHPAPTCEAFIAATPTVRRRYSTGHDKRVQGHSYPQEWYERAIGKLLEQVGGVDDVSIIEAVRLYHDRPTRVDEATLARVGREREEAGRRLGKSRDVDTWQRDMAQLEAEEQAARQPTETVQLSSGEVVSYLRSLPALWADAGPDGRQALATALFASTDVLGFEQMVYELTPDAIQLGLAAALPAVFELTCTIGEFGRGERVGNLDYVLIVWGVILPSQGLPLEAGDPGRSCVGPIRPLAIPMSSMTSARAVDSSCWPGSAGVLYMNSWRRRRSRCSRRKIPWCRPPVRASAASMAVT
jgi:hypothetical protein